MDWIMNLSMAGIADIMVGFCILVLALKIAVAKLSNDDEGYEEDED